MVIISDCGGTKGDWVYKYEDDQVERFITKGFNPVLQNISDLQQIIKEELPFPAEKVHEVYYYGAGMISLRNQLSIINALRARFNCNHIEAENDLLAACRATAGKQPGIVSILGTGSASCYYDGNTIKDKLPALGFIAGDEGGGSHLGRSILQSYFYREMPQDLKKLFETQYELQREKVLDRIYKKPASNKYLGEFANFIITHRANAFINKLIHEELDLFIRRHLLKYEGAIDVPCHFVGSIAWYLREELATSLSDNGLTIGNIVQKPINQLIIYHTLKQP